MPNMTPNPPKIVVIGAGQIGRETANQLAELGYDVHLCQINRDTGEVTAAAKEPLKFTAQASPSRNLIDNNSLLLSQMVTGRAKGKIHLTLYKSGDGQLEAALRDADIVSICAGVTLRNMASAKGLGRDDAHPLQGAMEMSQMYAGFGKLIADNSPDHVKVLSTAIPVEVVANSLYRSIVENWGKSKTRHSEFGPPGRVGAGATLLDTIRFTNLALKLINNPEFREKHPEIGIEPATEITGVYTLGSHGYGPYSDLYKIGLTASTSTGQIRFGGTRQSDGTYTGGKVIKFDDLIPYEDRSGSTYNVIMNDVIGGGKTDLMKAAFSQPVLIRNSSGERALHKEAGRGNALVIEAMIHPEKFRGKQLPLTVFGSPDGGAEGMFYGGVAKVRADGTFEELHPNRYVGPGKEREAFALRMEGLRTVNNLVATVKPETEMDKILALERSSGLAQQVGFI